MRAAIPCLLLLGATLSGCESHRNGVRCIGVNEEPEPGVKYELSVPNIVIGVLFVETLFVPIIVLLKEIRCPLPPPKATP